MILSGERGFSLFVSQCIREELATSARITRASELLNFGTVPVGHIAGLSVTDSRDNVSMPPDQGHHPGLCLSVQSSCSRMSVALFAMSRIPYSERHQLLAAMGASAEYIFLADIKLPERNIEIPGSLLLRSIARLIFPLQRDFIHSGGLEKLIYTEKRFSPIRRTTLLGGGIQCILLQCPF